MEALKQTGKSPEDQPSSLGPLSLFEIKDLQEECYFDASHLKIAVGKTGRLGNSSPTAWFSSGSFTSSSITLGQLASWASVSNPVN